MTSLPFSLLIGVHCCLAPGLSLQNKAGVQQSSSSSPPPPPIQKQQKKKAPGEKHIGTGGMADTRDPAPVNHADPRKSISAAPSFEEYLKSKRS